MPVAIVTGASRAGLGRALALDLASEGWSVVMSTDATTDAPLEVDTTDDRGSGRDA
jgi:NAD(P)-dependent dehydrogenase (short-subunit alcohol dehydrogenase family)